MEVLDYFAVSFVLCLLFVHGGLIHAPNSVDVVNAIFRSSGGGCYTLKPIVVNCDS